MFLINVFLIKKKNCVQETMLDIQHLFGAFHSLWTRHIALILSFLFIRNPVIRKKVSNLITAKKMRAQILNFMIPRALIFYYRIYHSDLCKVLSQGPRPGALSSKPDIPEFGLNPGGGGGRGGEG